MIIQLATSLSFIFCYWTCHGKDISVGSGQCLDDQRSLLLQLKVNLTFNPGNFTKLALWNQTLEPDCCNWKGVSCDKEGHVTDLDLSGEYITSELSGSSTLFSLKELQNLNLAYNKFNSGIPSGFQKLTNLSYLNLSNAGFVGKIPIEISYLTRLVVLDISTFYYLAESELKLENPNLAMFVQNLTEVRELYLDGINISQEGNEWCHALSSSLPDLQVLSMSRCNLSGPIDLLQTLKNLSVIRLDQNNLSSPVPKFFSQLSNLTILHLSSCGLNGIFPQDIFKVQTLTSLDISYNAGLHGYLPYFPQNGSLQRLIISYTNFSGALPNSLGNLRNLSRLDCSRSQFTGALPDSLSKLTELTYLDLSLSNFTGPIPSFGMAKKLTYIDLSDNHLSGPIPSGHFQGLQNLVNINLRSNFLNGSIPPSLLLLPSLKRIQLSFNQFDGGLNELSFFSNSALETIDLSSNNLGGPIPTSVFQLYKLSTHQLSSNNFSGIINLDMIHSLKNLTALDLSYNNLSIDANVTDAHPYSFPNMTNLNLVSCKLRAFPDFLRNQSKLTSLDLSNNQIQGKIPKWIWKLDFLSYLNLSHNLLMGLEEPLQNVNANLLVLDLHSNQIQGQIPVLPQYATYLDYSRNKFNSVIPLDITADLSFIIFLSLSNNDLQGSIPDSFCNTSYLQVFDLSHNRFNGTIPQCLTASENLRVLNLGDNRLVGNIPNNFTDSCALKTLDLNGNRLSGPLPKSLANCTMLEVLDLGRNQINDAFPCLLKNKTALWVMVLRENKFQGPIGCPTIKSSWQMLQIVDLAFNNFSGQLPGKSFPTWKAMMPDKYQDVSDLNHIQFQVLQFDRQEYYQDSVTVTIKGLQLELVKILTVFTSMDFSSNQLEGPIPEELMNFKRLYVLNLSHNSLSGHIPSSIGNLRQLESLDLSRNSFSGEIPLQLANLNFLSFLNLSFNNLAGKIPLGTQIQSFDAASFIGNGLCGVPLLTHCSQTHSRSPSEVLYKTESDWELISVGVGFGVGAGLVVAPLMFWERTRKWSNNNIDKILLVTLPIFGFVYTPDDEEDEEDADELNSEMEEDYDYDGDETLTDSLKFQGRYCVYCSKLDFSRKKAIHDPRCICHDSPTVSTSTSSSASFSS